MDSAVPRLRGGGCGAVQLRGPAHPGGRPLHGQHPGTRGNHFALVAGLHPGTGGHRGAEQDSRPAAGLA